MLKKAFFYFFFVYSSALIAQINWTSVDSLPQLYKKEAKPILLFIYTDWCKICKMQEISVFEDSFISQKLNIDYYTVKLDAEDIADRLFFGRNYQGASSNKYHQLAQYFGETNGKLIFPTTVVLNKNLEVMFKKDGYLGKENMLKLLDLSYNFNPKVK